MYTACECSRSRGIALTRGTVGEIFFLLCIFSPKQIQPLKKIWPFPVSSKQSLQEQSIPLHEACLAVSSLRSMGLGLATHGNNVRQRRQV